MHNIKRERGNFIIISTNHIINIKGILITIVITVIIINVTITMSMILQWRETIVIIDRHQMIHHKEITLDPIVLLPRNVSQYHTPAETVKGRQEIV